jgi:molecular chaperone DnaK
MVKEADKNAAEDKRKREEIDTRNRLDSMTYEVEKNAKEWSDRLPADLKSKLDSAVERARKALRGDDMNEIKAAQEELSKVFAEAGQSFYAQSQQSSGGPTGEAGGDATGGGAQGGATGGAAGSKQEDVVEADYEIVDDKK